MTLSAKRRTLCLAAGAGVFSADVNGFGVVFPVAVEAAVFGIAVDAGAVAGGFGNGGHRGLCVDEILAVRSVAVYGIASADVDIFQTAGAVFVMGAMLRGAEDIGHKMIPFD